jgi:hypothetical protein
MRYKDLLDVNDLKAYARSLNARAAAQGRAALSLAALRSIILESGGRCGWCDASLVGQPFEVDHIIPLADRGAHTAENLVVACPDCNRQKASQPPLKFAHLMVARRGHATPVIQRLLDHYKSDAHTQPGLFAL